MLNEKNIHKRALEKMRQKNKGIEDKLEKNDEVIEELEEKNKNVADIKKMMEQKKQLESEIENFEREDIFGEMKDAKENGQQHFLSLLPKEKLSQEEKTRWEREIDRNHDSLSKGTIWAGKSNWQAKQEIKTPEEYVKEVKEIIEDTKNKFENLAEEEKEKFHENYERAIQNTEAALKGFGLEALKHNMPEIAKDILEYTDLLKRNPLIEKHLEKQIKKNEAKKEKIAEGDRKKELDEGRKLARFVYGALTGKKSEESRPGYFSEKYFGYSRSFTHDIDIKTPEDYINAIQLEMQKYEKQLQNNPNNQYATQGMEEAKASLEAFGLEAMKYGDKNTDELVKKIIESR